MRYETPTLEVHGPIGRAWLDRPERRNVFAGDLRVAGPSTIGRIPEANLEVPLTWSAGPRLAATPAWARHTSHTQLHAYARTAALADATAVDGNFLAAATREDPARFLLPPE